MLKELFVLTLSNKEAFGVFNRLDPNVILVFVGGASRVRRLTPCRLRILALNALLIVRLFVEIIFVYRAVAEILTDVSTVAVVTLALGNDNLLHYFDWYRSQDLNLHAHTGTRT